MRRRRGSHLVVKEAEEKDDGWGPLGIKGRHLDMYLA